MASWEYYLTITRAVASGAKCIRRQVGAVIVDPDGRIVGTGKNGSPPGKPECTDGACPRGKMTAEEVPHDSSYDTGPGSCIAVHAEANALLFATARVRGCTMYVTDKPCDGCQRLIEAAGIKEVVVDDYAERDPEILTRGDLKRLDPFLHEARRTWGHTVRYDIASELITRAFRAGKRSGQEETSV